MRVNMKNILSLTVPWKKREAADSDSVGNIMCCTIIITEKEYGSAGSCSLLHSQPDKSEDACIGRLC